jgi:anti-sigma regulatory factor (Ser/Thr protein kinase)
MVALRLSSFEDVRVARECARDLAQAVGIRDPDAVLHATGELANNCVLHGDRSPGLLWISCGLGRLSMRFENASVERPTWCTRKPRVFGEFRAGGYGLQIAQALAQRVDCRWVEGRVVVVAEFV